jgi:2-keto-4-pentenoate hydratase/2-oxohepta-3-ene-1,7-dioic acid hydratase in catechol pathway
MRPSEVSGIIDDLSISLTFRGENKQSANSPQKIYKVPETLSHLGQFMDLKSGDLLLTGTPGGVIANATPKAVDILRSHIMNDAARRKLLTEEFKQTDPFPQPGDTVALTLKDEANGVDLGGQLSRIT